MAWNKTQIRREKAARLESLSIYSDAEIAQHIGMTPAGYAMMKRSPAYQSIILNLKHGIIRDYDAMYAENTSELRKRLRASLPAALDTIIDAVQQRTNPKLAFEAAKTMIEMDGRLAPVKRIGLPTEEQGGAGKALSDKDKATADEIVTALTMTKPNATETIQ
jgi:hypothetical protein